MEDQKKEGTDTPQKRRQRPEQILESRITSRSHEAIGSITADFLMKLLTPATGGMVNEPVATFEKRLLGLSNFGLMVSHANTQKGLLDVYSLMVRNAENKTELQKMITMKEWDNIATIKELNMQTNSYKGTIRGFEKLMYLYMNNKIVSDQDLLRGIFKTTAKDYKVEKKSTDGEDSLSKINLYKPPLERLITAGIVTKSVCIEMKGKGETMTDRELLSVFEGALVPYYFPKGDDDMDRIGSLMTLFAKILQSSKEAKPIDRPSKDVITSFLDGEGNPSFEAFRRFF